MSQNANQILLENLPKEIITEVKVFKTGKGSKTLAYANITLFDIFVVKNLRIVQGNKGVFIGMPSLKMRDGNYRDIFFPIKQEARELITHTLIKAYESETGESLAQTMVEGD
jgi:stage V sporulation protein G